MTYQTIFEIGPIAHYVENSRKTKDLWGASFLFSYLMGVLCAEIKKQNGKIERPYLDDNPLFQWIINPQSSSDIYAGSIPDQVCCVYEDDGLPKKVQKRFYAVLDQLYNDCWQAVKDNYFYKACYHDKDKKEAYQQLRQYFRLFYVTKKSDETGKWDDLMKAINSRGQIYSFDDFNDDLNSVKSKDGKCSLMADFKRLHTIGKSRRGGKDEQLSAMAVIKRGLLDHFDNVVSTDRFASTTSIAATVVKQILKEPSINVRMAIKEFIEKFFEENQIDEEFSENDIRKLRNLKGKREVIDHLPYEFYFTDHPISRDFRKAIKNEADTYLKQNPGKKVWIDSGFYAIVSLDGDNTGELFKLIKDDPVKTTELSRAIANYSNQAGKILRGKGQLIYSGGEDTQFIAHPVFLLELLEEFERAFSAELGTVINDKEHPLSISAGVYICNHKYPLKLAVRGAIDLLDDEAKKIDGKGSVVIKLVKGSGDAVCCWFKLRDCTGKYDLMAFKELIDEYEKKSIPRGFLYKLENDREVMPHVLLDQDEFLKYVEDILSRTRDRDVKLDPHMETLIKLSCNKTDETLEYNDLINRLYFARFLTGGQ
ncbi:MAG: type III-B CRISPR-associated protein Cas10/Cmr2 [Candidatus Hatepunaea meridiana]|nr:type III-B CRISPR-associated protein Cas10/Cmr2 [Candidatus Hatepunaea meridiana]